MLWLAFHVGPSIRQATDGLQPLAPVDGRRVLGSVSDPAHPRLSPLLCNRRSLPPLLCWPLQLLDTLATLQLCVTRSHSARLYHRPTNRCFSGGSSCSSSSQPIHCSVAMVSTALLTEMCTHPPRRQRGPPHAPLPSAHIRRALGAVRCVASPCVCSLKWRPPSTASSPTLAWKASSSVSAQHVVHRQGDGEGKE